MCQTSNSMMIKKIDYCLYSPESQNPARYHRPAEARESDEIFKKIYESHPRRCIVPNFKTWENKERFLEAFS